MCCLCTLGLYLLRLSTLQLHPRGSQHLPCLSCTSLPVLFNYPGYRSISTDLVSTLKPLAWDLLSYLVRPRPISCLQDPFSNNTLSGSDLGGLALRHKRQRCLAIAINPRDRHRTDSSSVGFFGRYFGLHSCYISDHRESTEPRRGHLQNVP